MVNSIRIADSKGRVTLPGFANAPVILEVVSENEVRVRKAHVIAADEPRFSEEQTPLVLSKRDARKVIASLENPPRPNAAARRAARRLKNLNG